MNDDKKQSVKNKEDRLAIDIGKRLLEARNGLGLSQQAVHSRSKLHDTEGVGVSRAVLSLYETGINKPGAREINILCKVLTITPNWLLFGSESPSKALQSSFAFLQGNEVDLSVRLAFALMALAPEERDAFSSLIFSLLTKKLGDIGLSSLMSTANSLSNDIYKNILETIGEASTSLPLQEIIDKFVQATSEGSYSNYGNLRPIVPDDEIEDFDPFVNEPPPPRNLNK